MLFMFEVDGKVHLSALDPEDKTHDYDHVLDYSIVADPNRSVGTVSTAMTIIGNVLNKAGVPFTQR